MGSRYVIAVLFFSGASLWAQPNLSLPADSTKSEQGAGNEEKGAQPTFTLENSLSLRDPFRRFTPKANANTDENGLIPELERYELDKYRLMGIITGPKKNKALVLSTVDGRMHIVAEKQRIGVKRGVVKKIAPGSVVVEEKVVNLLGQEEKVETAIEFAKPKPPESEFRTASPNKGVGAAQQYPGYEGDAVAKKYGYPSSSQPTDGSM